MRQVEAQLIELARTNAHKSCPRTVFPRNATPEMLLEGSAEADMLAVLSPSPLRRGCLDYYEELISRDELPPFLHVFDHPEGFPPRRNSTAQPLSGRSLKLGDQVKLEELCGPLFEHVRRSTRYRYACNPNRPGGPLVKDSSISLINVGRLLLTLVRHRLTEGNPEDVKQGLHLMTDASQFSNVVALESPLMPRLIATALQGDLLMQLEVLFNSRAPLSQELLQDYLVESKIIQDGWPNLSSMLEYEALSNVFSNLRWMEKDSCWKNIERGKKLTQTDLSSCVSWKELKLFFALYALNSRLAAASCAPGDLDRDCSQKAGRVFARQRSYTRKHGTPNSTMHRFLREILTRSDERPKADPLEMIVSADCGGCGSIMRQMERISIARFTHTATRLLARYRLEYQCTGECPAKDFFERSDIRETRIDPVSGVPMQVKYLAPGRFVIRPGVPIGTKLKPEEQPAVFIQCPFNDFGRD